MGPVGPIVDGCEMIIARDDEEKSATATTVVTINAIKRNIFFICLSSYHHV
jgi:hypothetical protein